MKKIYLSLALTASMVAGVNAQSDKKSNLTEDQAAVLNVVQPKVNNAQIMIYKGTNPTTAGCDTLSSTYSFNNGQSGNMFDLVNTSTVTINIMGLAQVFQGPTSTTMEIYHKLGSYAGFEGTSSAWLMDGTTPLTVPSGSVPVNVPITLTITIPPSGTVSLYVTSTSTIVGYTNGTNQMGVLSQRNGLQILEGRGIAYPFGSAFGVAPASRIWNGVLGYCSPLVTGVNNITINETETSVYPNPSVGKVNVNITNTIGVENAIANIYDMAGRLVYTQSNINVNNFEVNHNLQAGVYQMQVVNKGSVALNKKISVQ